MVLPRVDFPQPDSPTRPSVSPFLTERLTWSTAFTTDGLRFRSPFFAVKYLDKSFVSLVERRQQTVVVRFEKMSQQIFLTQDYFEALAATTLKARIGESDKLIEVIFDVRQKKDYEILENLIQFGQKLVEIKQRKED